MTPKVTITLKQQTHTCQKDDLQAVLNLLAQLDSHRLKYKVVYRSE